MDKTALTVDDGQLPPLPPISSFGEDGDEARLRPMGHEGADPSESGMAAAPQHDEAAEPPPAPGTETALTSALSALQQANARTDPKASLAHFKTFIQSANIHAFMKVTLTEAMDTAVRRVDEHHNKGLPSQWKSLVDCTRIKLMRTYHAVQTAWKQEEMWDVPPDKWFTDTHSRLAEAVLAWMDEGHHLELISPEMQERFGSALMSQLLNTAGSWRQYDLNMWPDQDQDDHDTPQYDGWWWNPETQAWQSSEAEHGGWGQDQDPWPATPGHGDDRAWPMNTHEESSSQASDPSMTSPMPANAFITPQKQRPQPNPLTPQTIADMTGAGITECTPESMGMLGKMSKKTPTHDPTMSL